METTDYKKVEKKRSYKQNIIPLAIIVTGTILMAFLILGPKDEEIQEEIKVVPAEVETMVISREDSRTAKLEKVVVLRSSNAAEAVAEYTGRIRQVNFEVGNFVSRGTLLAVFDQSDMENSARISLESAHKNLLLAEKVKEKTKDMLRRELDKGDEAAKIQVNTARLQVEQARLQLEQAEMAHGKTFIKAPITGTVISRNVDVGDYVISGQTIAKIMGDGKLEADVSLNSSQARMIRMGDEVDIVISGELYKGEVSYLSPVASSDNERFEVNIRSKEALESEANRSAKVILTLHLNEQRANSFFIPLEAVIIGQQKTEIFVVDSGKANSIEIKIGEVVCSDVEVIEGINVGDEIIIKNGRNLQDGQDVKTEK